MKTILKYIDKKNRFGMLLAAVFIVAQCFFDLRIPDYVTEMTEMLQADQPTVDAVIHSGVGMLLCALISFSLAVASSFLINKMSSSMGTKLRSAVFDRVLDYSLEEVGRFSESSLITRCTQDINMIQVFFSAGLALLIKAPFLSGIAIFKISGQQMEWTVATVVAVLLILLMMAAVLLYCSRKMTRMQQCVDSLNKRGKEHISGLRVIRAFHTERFHQDRFEKVNSELEGISISNGRMMALMLPGFVFVMYALNLAIYLAGIVIIGGAENAQRAALYADMIAFSSYALQIVQAFIFLVRAIMLLPRTTVSVKRVQEVLCTMPSIRDGKGEQAKETGTIEFRNVSFRYPFANGTGNTGENDLKKEDNYVLRDISFRVEQGQTVAFIGSTGSGKTSLMNLIPRLYDVSEGQVLVDGVDVKDYRLKELRNRIGYVPQKNRLFTGTIAGNIAYGDNGRFSMTLTEIKKASEVGQAKEFIEQKSGGYEAEVAAGGSNFSGGQRQRLAISRAVCRDPEIYLFDDSFSALDFLTDRKLRQALKETSSGATVLIVAQRVGTIQNADRIYVMEKGRIVGSGTHEELLSSCRIYQEIAESQISGETA